MDTIKMNTGKTRMVAHAGLMGMETSNTCAGFIAPCVVQVHWTTPPVLSAFLATGGDWRAAVWQVIEIVIAMAIYLPFIKVFEAQSRSRLS
jgi:PTS system cellobiose-specific IIC component